MLINKTYKVSNYEVFEKIDKGKTRLISKYLTIPTELFNGQYCKL